MFVHRLPGTLVLVVLTLAIGCRSKTPPTEAPKTDGVEKEMNVQNAEPGSVEALFDGFPKELMADLRGNKAKRAKANEWLVAYVFGKSKPIKITVPAEPSMPHAGEKKDQFVVKLELFGKRGSLLGDDWVVVVHDGRFQKREGVFGSESFEFVDLSEADAKWLSELSSVTIEGTVDQATIVPDEKDESIISLKLKDPKVNGKTFKSTTAKK